MRGGAECYVMRYLVAMISTLRSPLRVTLFSLTLIGLLSTHVGFACIRAQVACMTRPRSACMIVTGSSWSVNKVYKGIK